jgi:DNA gyrase subunit A
MSETPLLDENTNNGGNIQPLSITNEISESYINYAMSVIVMRALPDTRDGMKPVIRRILYAMNDMGMTHNSKHKKSARIVWEVLWKYHPHGDSSVYEAMVRLAQPWSLRYPLVDGQGNFGSIDGDGAASMRYTEARLSKIASEMLEDIDQDTVSWRPNFDNSLDEPVTLPTKFPNHLCNGTMGIAVGMATNMAPHNLTEVIDACLYLMSHAEATVDDLMQIIKWPDFPTGWFIFDPESILEIYRKGKWSIVVRGKTHIEQSKTGDIIVIDEIPYQVNKSTLVEKIWELVVDKKIDGITDIRDESAKNIIRVALSLRRGVNAQKILTQLYKMTELQSTFPINNVSLIEKWKQPRLLNILDLITEFVVYRREIVYRRSVFQLGKAKDRLHILEGLRKAIDIIDAVIATIRGSDTKQEAKEKLMKEFEFSDAQAEHILMMRLQSLVGLELNKILDEIDEKKKLIEYLENIINDPIALDGVVTDEMNYIKKTYGDKRKTILVENESGDLKKSLKAFEDQADQIKEDVIVWLSDSFDLRVLYQSRVSVIPEDTIDLIYTHNQDKIIVITDIGELVVQRLKDLGSFQYNSVPLNFHKHFNLKGRVIFANTLHAPFDHLLLMTSDNNIKKIDKNLVLSFKKFPTSIINLPGKNEKILNVLPVSDSDTIGIATRQGRLLMFPSKELRPMGKTAGWVNGINLQEGDKVSVMFLYQDEPFILLNTATKALMLTIDDLRIRKRARKGDQVVDLEKNDNIIWGISIYEGAIRLRLNDGSIQTVHSNDCYLDEPGAGPEKITAKPIVNMFRPREEKKDSVAYKEARKAEEKAKKLEEEKLTNEENNWWLFTE